MLLLAAFAAAATDPRETVFEEQPAVVLSNDRIRLTVLTRGAGMASLTLADDDEQVNPLWNPGPHSPFDGLRGHFIALDGFGEASAEERAAGLPPHGEARLQQYSLLSIGDGLVSQIPALVTSVAAGILTTRTGDGGDLSRQFKKQLLFYPKALSIAALMMFFFAVVPGLPTALRV